MSWRYGHWDRVKLYCIWDKEQKIICTFPKSTVEEMAEELPGWKAVYISSELYSRIDVEFTSDMFDRLFTEYLLTGEWP